MSAYGRKKEPVQRDGFVIAAEALQYLAGKVRELKEDDEDINNNSKILKTVRGNEPIKDELEQEAQRIESIAKKFNERVTQSREDPQGERAWRQDSDFAKLYDKLVCQALTVYSYDLVETRAKILERLRMTDNNNPSTLNDEHSFKMKHLEDLLVEVERYKEAYCRSSTNQP